VRLKYEVDVESAGLILFASSVRAARCGVRHREASISLRSFVLQIAKLVSLCALAFAWWGAEIARAEGSDAEKASYADALAYCRGDVSHPMALRSDRRVLCLNGRIYAVHEFLLADGLEHGGLFVVRGSGGDIAASIELADILLTREATVIVNDYCVAICANYLFIASVKTFVPKDALVAWINHPTGPNKDNCLRFVETSDPRAPRLQEMPCAFPDVDMSIKQLIGLKKKFFKERMLALEEPPESITVRRILKRKYDETGKYPYDVYWTWNPRYYVGAITTQVIYEAYPQSQSEVDAILARIGLRIPVIYDP
jgi:hypothetical protein